MLSKYREYEKHKDDISIGQDQWIEWIDISAERNTAVEIDDIIMTLADFWTRLETQCVAGCCGIDAFEFWPENIREAGAEFDVQSLQSQIRDIKAEIESMTLLKELKIYRKGAKNAKKFKIKFDSLCKSVYTNEHFYALA